MSTAATAGMKIGSLLLLVTASIGMADDLNKTSAQKADTRVIPFDLYRTPATVTPTESERALNCLALEREITDLMPKTYSYKPDFYNDPYQGAAIWIGSTLFMPAYAISGYAGYLQYQENGRIISAEERIETLRHLKAQHHCFES
ncbi:hypothetical protein [Sedimenticola selenatireducens]|nr:hypothetical protein [Sedimenticola selenatireducens]